MLHELFWGTKSISAHTYYSNASQLISSSTKPSDLPYYILRGPLSSFLISSHTQKDRSTQPPAATEKPSSTKTMQIRHLTSILATLNPFSPLSKTPRLFLSLLPPTARSSGLKITTNILPQNSDRPNALTVTFKDKKEMKWEFRDVQKEEGDKAEKVSIADVLAEVERHGRVLGRKEDLGG
ncbi:MAG: hypothetical protein Q9160_004916 [Pyrenula sp. 1 TL-2023]